VPGIRTPDHPARICFTSASIYQINIIIKRNNYSTALLLLAYITFQMSTTSQERWQKDYDNQWNSAHYIRALHGIHGGNLHRATDGALAEADYRVFVDIRCQCRISDGGVARYSETSYQIKHCPKKKYLYQGCTNSGRQVAVATKFSAVATNISGAYNFDIPPRFLENLCTLDLHRVCGVWCPRLSLTSNEIMPRNLRKAECGHFQLPSFTL
jgi:hypothetical protein